MDVFWLYDGFDKKKIAWKGGKAINPETGVLLEALIDDDNFKEIYWLEKALEAAKKVAKIGCNNQGTGFLISEDVFITSHHIFNNKTVVESADLWFNYQKDVSGKQTPIDYWKCDTDQLYEYSEKLDYSVVKVKPNKNGKKPGKVYGYFDLKRKTSLSKNQRANIIQHRAGRHKEIAFRENQIKAIDEDSVQYVTDTQSGSSGSPVLDDDFNVIAIHSRSVQHPDNKEWHLNHGFLISNIYEEIKHLL